MGVFSYTAITVHGARIRGTVEAANEKEAAVEVRRLGHTPIAIREGGGLERNRVVKALFGRCRPEDLLGLYVQLHDMMGAGISLLVCIESLENQAQNRRLKTVLRDIGEALRKGKSFSCALEQHRDVFSDLLIHMIRSGESSGKMDAALGSYAQLYEADLDLRQRVLGALYYPAILFMLGLAVILFLVVFIIPKFVTIFADAGVALPLPTIILYAFGIGLVRYWYLILAGVALAVLAIRRYVRTRQGRQAFDALKISLPVVGPLIRNVELSRFATTLAMLLRSGVSVMRALELTRGIVQNVVMENALTVVAGGIEKGEGFAVMMMRAGSIFPAGIIQMVAVGEETGNLDGMLEKASLFYDKGTAASIKRLTVVIEPLFLIVIGCAVGVIMASILMPLFTMINAVKM